VTAVTIFHNVSRDAGFGLNRVFLADPHPGVGAEVRSHELVRVFTYDIDPPVFDVDAALNQAFETFNIGTNELAAQYRARRLRSLSVGDVVQVRSDFYACDSVGWSKVSADDLNILDAEAAEKVIRDRYEFEPGEELSITVPWTQG
jgi:hypothetical protein